jgi:hypothetical protein
MNWCVEPVPALRGYTVEWAEPGQFYLSRRNDVFHTTDLGAPASDWTRVARFPAPWWRRAGSTVNLGQRLLRFRITNVVPLPGGDLFITFDRSVAVLRSGQLLPIADLARPCRVLRGACAVTREGDVYFGEYLDNRARSPIRIYRFRRGDTRLEVAHEFRAGAVRHVHGIYADLATGDLLCLTGDAPHECMMMRSTDGFRSLDVVGGGDESWRAVSVVCRQDAIYYGTDAEHRANHLVRLDRRTGVRATLAEVDGSVFYSASIGDTMFFGTTAEAASAERVDIASLWQVDRDDRCTRLISFPKDRWHRTLFMFGTILFPAANRLADELYFHLVAAVPDNETFRVRRAGPIA